MPIFCKHNWEKVTEKEIKSPAEKCGNPGGWRTLLAWYFESTYVCILKCKKCGKLDKTIVTNP